MRSRKHRAARSLTATLASAFLVLSVVVLLISSGLQLVSNIQAQQQALARQQQLVAQDAAKAVSNFIQEKLGVLETTVQLANPAKASQEEQRQILASLLGLQSAFRQLAILDLQDQEVTRLSRLSQMTSGQLADQFIDDLRPQIQQGERYVSPVYIDPVTSEPLVIIAVPVVNALREFQGTLIAEVNLKFMWDLVDRLPVGETGKVFVVDRQGNLIAFGDIARVLRGENVRNLEKVGEFIASNAPADATPAHLTTGIQGTTVVGTYVPLGTPDWAVVAELPWREAYREVIRGAAISVGVTLAMAALAGLIGAYMARRLVVPLINLTGTATRIAAGETELQAAVGGPSEIARLAAAFNSMTQQLRGLIGGLEQRVAERTQDLARRSTYLEATARVAQEASATLNVANLLPRVAALISEQFDFYHTGIFLIDPTGEWAELKAVSSAGGQHMLQRGHRLRVEDRGIVGYVAHRERARVVSDTSTDDVFLHNPDLPDTRSEMALPLQAHGQIIGVLDVQSTVPQAFSEEDVAVLQTLADQVALAISNARLFTQVEESLETERRAYGELSRQAWVRFLAAQSGLGVVSNRRGVSSAVDVWEPQMREAMQKRQVTIAGDAGTALAVPIQVRGQVIGAIKVELPEGVSAWTSDQVAMMQTLTEQLGVALESARLYQDTQRRAAREQMVGEVTGRIRQELDLEEVLKTTVDQIQQALGLEKAAIRVVGRGQDAALRDKTDR